MGVLFHKRPGFSIEAVSKLAENAGDFDCQGTVDVDGEALDRALVHHPVKVVDQVLSPAYGEGGNDQLPPGSAAA